MLIDTENYKLNVFRFVILKSRSQPDFYTDFGPEYRDCYEVLSKVFAFGLGEV